MSVIFNTMLFSNQGGWYLFALPTVVLAFPFSILLDAYPSSGRYLTACRFYGFKLVGSSGIIFVLLLSNYPELYFERTVGEVTFSGSALLFTAALNLIVFGARNFYQLVTEPECLVLLNSLMEYSRVTDEYAVQENEKYIKR